MSSYRPGQYNRARGGFTLLELLAAAAMFLVIIVALYSVFYSALRLRERANDSFEDRLSKDYVVSIIERDLAAALAPTGILAGPFVGEKEEQGSLRLDRLEIHTASGTIDEDDPWPDVQKVEYSAIEPEDTENLNEKDLVRSVTRNLLSSIEEEPEQQRQLGDVQSLEFGFYDGESWQESWDSTTQENELPRAIRVRIAFLPEEETESAPLPIELIVPIAVETISTESTEEQGTERTGGESR